eukprot:scaffold322971_cov18-Prasinocladus_malaysianus.AAC.1
MSKQTVACDNNISHAMILLNHQLLTRARDFEMKLPALRLIKLRTTETMLFTRQTSVLLSLTPAGASCWHAATASLPYHLELPNDRCALHSNHPQRPTASLPEANDEIAQAMALCNNRYTNARRKY